MNKAIKTLSFALGQKLASSERSVSVAESCTGGGVGYAITETPGSSRWFQRGFIAYSNEAKSELLGIPLGDINTHGAVSQYTVETMAKASRAIAGTDYAIAVSGVAGPEGGSVLKPVGTVWLAWAMPDGAVFSSKKHFDGDRESVRLQTIELVLSYLVEKI